MKNKNPTLLRIENALILCVDDIVKGIGRKEEGDYYGTLTWNSGSTIRYKLSISINSKNVTLDYKRKGTPKIYKIDLSTVKSNLGIGDNYYFICPFSKLRCKKMYLVGDSDYFMHRNAYGKPLYYFSQTLSENLKLNYRIQKSEYDIRRAESEHPKAHYKNRTTRIKEMLIYKRYKYSILLEHKQDKILKIIREYEKKHKRK